jgi:hypothetical protein
MPPQPFGNLSAPPRHKNGELRTLQSRDEPQIRQSQYVDENLTNCSGDRDDAFVDIPAHFVSDCPFNEIEGTSILGHSTLAGDISPITNGAGPPSTDNYSISFDRRILEFWPRLHDTETWRFCVTSLLSHVDIFVRTGSSFFVHSSVYGRNVDLPPSLRHAYSICCSYKVRTEAECPFVERILENEIETISHQQPATTLKDNLALLQTMLLYYIMVIFGGAIHRQTFVDKSEILLAHQTALVETEELSTRQTMTILTKTGLLSVEEMRSQWLLCESARKVIVFSYLAREIRHVLRFGTCYLLRNLIALPVSNMLPDVGEHGTDASNIDFYQSGHIVSYDEFVHYWETGNLSRTDEFSHLLVAACKGIDAANSSGVFGHVAGN